MNIQEYSDSNLLISVASTLLLYDPISGKDQALPLPPIEVPPNAPKVQPNKKETSINCLSISPSGNYTAISTEQKQVVVFDKTFKACRNFVLARTASKVIFSQTDDILVADKTGDVYLYKHGDDKNAPTLLLGHLSMILDITFSKCGKYLITCDRDEKIRVSNYPNTYNIESYCLGHSEFVTSVKVVGNDLLLSASGDGTVRLWNFLTGKELAKVFTNNYIQETNLLEKFCNQMDEEKVDVEALPVVEMQCFQSEHLFVALSVYSCSSVQIYKINLETHAATFVQNINSVSNTFNYCLGKFLYLVDSSKLNLYTLGNESYALKTSIEMEEFYSRFKDLFNYCINSEITVLYKRKFDNVKEYLERKRLRLETK